jgi:hypothetical protein
MNLDLKEFQLVANKVAYVRESAIEIGRRLVNGQTLQDLEITQFYERVYHLKQVLSDIQIPLVKK